VIRSAEIATITPLLQLIENVYEAALDEGLWRNLASEIARTFGSTSTTLQIQRIGASSQILSMTENVSARINVYREHYWKRDIWVERAVQNIGLSRVGSSADMITDKEFQETEFYRDWCRHLDVFYVVGAVFPTGRGELGVLGIHRPRSAGTYEEKDKYLVSRFLPHLQRALRVRDQLAQAALQRQVSLVALDRSETATLLVSPDNQIIYANPQAEGLLADGTVIRSRNGRLTATAHNNDEQMSALIRETSGRTDARPQNDGIMSLPRMYGQSLSVLVAPFRLVLHGQPAAGAIIFIRDPDRSITAKASLGALFKLTPTEARIAESLANGKTIAEIAAAHRASLQTVRKQLKIIFAKTGTNRQAQCVALILRSIVTIARD
jgi:DNA-binding CsgD family transcriptional regulator